MAVIEIDNVTKIYKNGVKGLENVTLGIESGVFGLLGRNGAGKTTLMRIIAAILRPTAGSVKVCGYDAAKAGDEVRRNIGYLPQELNMYNNLSALDFVTYMALLKGIKNPGRAAMEKLEEVGMAEYRSRAIGRLSGGMKRRVGIAQAMVGDPRVIISDEPTAGLDPEERAHFREMLSRYAGNGRTVILSTHIIEDVYQVCPLLAVLRKGSLFFRGTADSMLERVRGRVKVIDVKSEPELAELQKKAVLISAVHGNDGIKARVMDEAGSLPQAPVQETLEDAYIYCMGGKEHA